MGKIVKNFCDKTLLKIKPLFSSVFAISFLSLWLTTSLTLFFASFFFYSATNKIEKKSFALSSDYTKNNIISYVESYNDLLNDINKESNKEPIYKALAQIEKLSSDPLKVNPKTLREIGKKNGLLIHLLDYKSTEILLSSKPIHLNKNLEKLFPGIKELLHKNLKPDSIFFRYTWSKRSKILTYFGRKLTKNGAYVWSFQKKLWTKKATRINKITSYLRSVHKYDSLIERVGLYSSDFEPKHSRGKLKLPKPLDQSIFHKDKCDDSSSCELWKEISLPHEEEEPKFIKYVGIKFNNKMLKEVIDEGLSQVYKMILLSLLFSLFVSYFFSRFLGQPIFQLLKTIKLIDKDTDSKSRVPSSWNKELNELGLAFNKLLEKLEIKTQKTKKMAKEILNIADAERKTISRDIHDSVGQLLIAANYKLAENQNKEAQKVILSANEELRNIYDKLEPRAIEHMSFHDAILFYLQKFFSRSFKTIVEVKSIEKLNISQRLQIYRIIQEGIANARKHAPKISYLTIRATHKMGFVSIKIENDFVPDSPRKTGFGRGLKNMSLRAQAFGGSLKVNEQNGKFEILVSLNFLEDKE